MPGQFAGGIDGPEGVFVLPGAMAALRAITNGSQATVQRGRCCGRHRDHTTVDLPDRAEILLAHMRRRAAVLAVPGIVDDQHPAIMRRSGRVGQ
ncbi:hypothetical protein ACFXKC_08835 [Streptomyces sp. NPDC059340]|uniref:hypothetical protein n=1 Tax=Streptomyces sp. NPDC059340 TaxID=3346806 RepID=UPI0036AB2CAC